VQQCSCKVWLRLGLHARRPHLVQDNRVLRLLLVIVVVRRPGAVCQAQRSIPPRSKAPRVRHVLVPFQLVMLLLLLLLRTAGRNILRRRLCNARVGTGQWSVQEQRLNS